MTETFQHWGLTYEWSWFLATIIGILLAAGRLGGTVDPAQAS